MQLKKKRIAIMYDFDKTLSNKDMQEYKLIPELGYKDVNDFWNEVSVLSKEHRMDRILAYMYLLLKKSEAKNRPIRKKDFIKLGEDVEFYPGVLTWFDRINEIGRKLGLEVEHYIISSGMKEIIEGTKIYNNFKKVYACKYYYDVNEVAKWPSLVVNYTTKTQYIFRVNKQILDENEDKKLNEYTSEENRPIPFKRMIYVGDGITDVPCMKLIKEYKGKSIVVYRPSKKSDAEKLVNKERANFMCEADYSANGPMERLVSNILSYMAYDETLDVSRYEN